MDNWTHPSLAATCLPPLPRGGFFSAQDGSVRVPEVNQARRTDGGLLVIEERRQSGNTLSYWAWGAFLHLFIAAFAGYRRRKTLSALPLRIWSVGIAGGMVSMTAYGLILYAKNFAPLGAVSALRETSVIFATLIGYFFLKEGSWKRRVGAAVIMACGIALISLAA